MSFSVIRIVVLRKIVLKNGFALNLAIIVGPQLQIIGIGKLILMTTIFKSP